MKNRYQTLLLAVLFTVAAGQAQNKEATTKNPKSAPVEIKIDNFSFTPPT